MKNLYNLSPEAYKEGYEILNFLPQGSKSKIPKEIWNLIQKNMNLNYRVTLKNIERPLEDTNMLLAIIFKEYLATEEEKKIIKAKENIVKEQREKEAYHKYNPNKLFKKN